MKLTTALLFLSMLQMMAATGFSQYTEMSLKFENTELREVLREIEEMGEVYFLYSSKLVDVERKVSIDARNENIENVLAELFRGENVDYTFMNDQIILAQGVGALQASLIRGTVTDEAGEPMIGVTVSIKGTSSGTITNQNGEYELEVPEDAKILVYQFVGMVTQEIPIQDQKSIYVTMETDVLGLEEVIVIGYGTMKKSDLTGAVGSVSDEQIMERPAINISQSLETRIAGLHVQTNSGRPGGNVKTVIRGYNSYAASNDPLYVVDGIIWPDGIETLNPNDVASIDVLKDASATAIYGTRGSNGVIMVTTKRGSEGGQVRYDSYMSINWLPEGRKLRPLNSKEWMFIEEEQYKNAPKYDPAGFASGKYADPVTKRMDYLIGNTLGNRELFELDANGVPQPLYDVDWQDECTRTSISQSHNLSYTGGNDLSSYGLFLGYTDDQGILKRSYAKRFNVRAVMDHQIKDWLKVGGTVSYARLNQDGLDDRNSYDIIRQMVESVTFIPYKYEDGVYGYPGDYLGLEKFDSPLAKINEQNWLYKTNRFGGNTYATIRIIPGLEFTTTLGVNLTNQNDTRYQSAGQISRSSNSVRISSSDDSFVQWSNRLNYTKSFNDNHRINVLAGMEMQKSDRFSYRTGGDKGDDYFKWYNLSSSSITTAPSSSATDYKMLSYFGRFNYNYGEKYLLTVTGRYDGSSRFGEDNRYAFFPSSAIAWRISEEDFLNNISTISNLKLRVSYGLTGNSEIGSYRSLAYLGNNEYVLGGSRVIGTAIDRLANPLLQWEKTAEFNVGLDLGLLNNRISLAGEYYSKNTTGLLFDAPVPATSGYTFVTKNIGSMGSTGFELTLNTVNISKSNFSWSTNFNISNVKNKVTALGENDEDIIYGFKDALILRVGEPAGSIFGWVRDGVYGTGDETEAGVYGKQPGDVRIVDQNSDGVINNEDRVIIGKGQPDFYGGLSNIFKYKAFDLIVELSFWQGNDVFNNGLNSGEARQGIANSFATVLDAWTPENQDAILEQVRSTKAYYTYLMDTRNLFDGSFIRGKNLSLGYRLPKLTSSNLGLNDLRIYVSVQNFFLLTRYDMGYDPEGSNYYDDDPISQGVGYHGYPRPRTFTLGLNVGF